MDKNGLFLQLYSRGKAPNRDYYGLTVTQKQVILNIWNITHGPHVFPKNYKCTIEDFTFNTFLMEEVNRLFGNYVLEFCKSLSQRDSKLQCMPTKIFLYILRHLAANDIIRLSQTSKIFFELCNREAVHKLLFRKEQKSEMITELPHMEGYIQKISTKSSLPVVKITNTQTVKPRRSNNLKSATTSNHTVPPIIKKLSDAQILSKNRIPKSEELSHKIDLKAVIDSNIKSKPTHTSRLNTAININLATKNDFQENFICKRISRKEYYTNPFRCPSEIFKAPSTMTTKTNIMRNKSISSSCLNNAKITNIEDVTTQNNKLNNVKLKTATVNLINNLEKLPKNKEKNVNLIVDSRSIRDKSSSLKKGLKKMVSFKNA